MTETERPSALTGHTHVREAEDFDSVYMQGVPPWDIGRSQPAFAELAERGLLAGRVLDAGCGTGEHTLMAAALGREATGFDVAGQVTPFRYKCRGASELINQTSLRHIAHHCSGVRGGALAGGGPLQGAGPARSGHRYNIQ